MSTYLIVQVKEKEQITPLKRKEYISSLYGKFHEVEKTMGFLKKFSYALGYKKYEANSKYVTPEDIIQNMFYAYVDGDVIFEFYIPKGETVAFDNSYSFENGDIGRKWANFLSKVFPELEVTIKVSHKIPSRGDALSSYFFKFIQDFPVTIETSISEVLNQNEINKIKKVVEVYKENPLKFKLLQYNCNTCKSNHEDKPIHLELDYWWSEEESKKTHEEIGLEYNGPTCFICSNSVNEEDLCLSCYANLNGKIIMEVN